jgi:signal transduction histidine kinase
MEPGRRWRPDWRDVALALGVAVLLVVATPFGESGGTDLDAFGYLLLVASGLVLVLRRRAPVAVLVVALACLLGYQLRDYPDVTAIPVMVAVYTAVRAGRRTATVAVTGAGLAVALLTASPAAGETLRDVTDRRFPIGWIVAAGVTAEVTRQREAAVRAANERAAEAERTREETARRRAGEERLRIARELHDSLTHSISVIKVQAGVAVHLARKRGEDVPEALLAIQEASSDATRELRATLDVLRTDVGDPDGDGLPASGLDRLDELVERARAAGVPATVTVDGDERPLPPEVDRAAYRIVQEALTNVGRHAGRPATVSVRLAYRDHGLAVQIDDDGQATPAVAPVPGTGLIGMRERVTALGGQLRAEPRPEGGFTVRAELPANGSGNADGNGSSIGNGTGATS